MITKRTTPSDPLLDYPSLSESMRVCGGGFKDVKTVLSMPRMASSIISYARGDINVSKILESFSLPRIMLSCCSYDVVSVLSYSHERYAIRVFGAICTLPERPIIGTVAQQVSDREVELGLSGTYYNLCNR